MQQTAIHSTRFMNNLPLLRDLQVFVLVARCSSFIAAAEQLGVSAAFISKRIAILEKTLNLSLLHRTTRKVAITEDGKRIYQWMQRILNDIDHMMDDVSVIRQQPRGLLRVVSSIGFGRRFVAPALSALTRQYPELDIRLYVSDKLTDLIQDEFDLDVRVGNEISSHLIARKLSENYRILCAAPHYLQHHGLPKKFSDLATHSCLVIKERDHPFGLWRMQNKTCEETVKVTGTLSANHGEIVRQWCLEGHGIALRSVWDVKEDINAGRLIRILPDYYQTADIWAVYVRRLENSAKMRVAVEFLRHYFQQHI